MEEVSLKPSTTLICFIPILTLWITNLLEAQNYTEYHKQINRAEVLISDGHFQRALNRYSEIFSSYDFIFLRDYKVASQVALYLDEREKALQIIEKGLAAGWDLKDLRRHKYLSGLRNDPDWDKIKGSYPDLRKGYLEKTDNSIREQVHKIFKSDQRLAFGALLRIGKKAKERFATKRFAPQSEHHIRALIKILQIHGYPGEQLIGNDYWMSTILSHHNSISTEYVVNDTLFSHIRPLLLVAIQMGQMSPYEFALIDDWYIAVASCRREPGYGYLNPSEKSTLERTNQLRANVGLRSVELRNRLVDVESKTGINLYLPDWIDGKVIIESE